MNLFALALVAATTLTGSNDTPTGDKKPATTIQYGESVKAGNGTLRSFVRLDAKGKPTQLGVAISEATLKSLPAEDAYWVLTMPKGSEKSQVQHVSFNWMPHGHEPDGVYNVPHFDCHFYYTSNEERMGIVENDPRFGKDPEGAYLPKGYVKGPAIPQMGAHWIDPTSPELNGKPFTTTFIYGTLDGKVTFTESMFTLDFLKKVQDERLPVKQPEKVEKAGVYPTDYRYVYNAAEKQYEVILENLQSRQ
ncbi:hypothetical protein GO730_37180 [Spirosoma sp. HMF3257]|uniref:TTHB210-like domain-containing protein n=1 Tax=Spirosoma telluris TaxID=2183553 RepID=A0A327NW78_9BACT|nr:hypothetical protein [Spirosoma telluris]RAI78286.1 hypothetical protein HMF3257_37110 [Spirosoma telluris]